ncbi:MAG TPA: hypothetical protein VHU88_18390, partial [Sporichthyaceae bacterium]|nr:hypothetical protein [Sporichthyaceae bacterium]
MCAAQAHPFADLVEDLPFLAGLPERLDQLLGDPEARPHVAVGELDRRVLPFVHSGHAVEHMR